MSLKAVVCRCSSCRSAPTYATPMYVTRREFWGGKAMADGGIGAQLTVFHCETSAQESEVGSVHLLHQFFTPTGLHFKVCMQLAHVVLALSPSQHANCRLLQQLANQLEDYSDQGVNRQ